MADINMDGQTKTLERDAGYTNSPAMNSNPNLTNLAPLDAKQRVSEKVELKRTIGLLAGSSLVIGMIIGSGIFISPKGVLRSTGSVGLCLLVWAVTGIITLGSSLCYAELGTMIPVSGGAYTYIRLGLGNPMAFAYVLQSIFITNPGAIVIILLTFSKYTITLLPTCGSPETLEKCITAAAILTLVIVNSYSTRLAGYIAIVTTVAKITALLVVIVGGIVTISQGTTSELGTGFAGTSQDPAGLALAIYSANWAYGGGDNLNNVVEEIKNPSKNIPRAAIISILVVIVLYVMTNVSYLAVMTRSELLSAEAVGFVFADRVLEQAAKIIPVAVMISTFGAANNSIFGGSRVIFAAARDKNIPDFLSYIQVHQLTPTSAMILTVTLTMIMLAPADISTMINYIGFLSAFFSGAVFVSHIIFRVKKMKDVERSMKIPLIIPILMVAVQVYLFLAPLVVSPELQYLYVAAGVFGGSALLYIPFIHFRLKLPFYDNFVAWIQLVVHVCPPAKTD